MKQGKAAKARSTNAVAPKRRKAPKSGRERGRSASAADLKKQLDHRTRELREALEQQATTSDILKVISGLKFDLQLVLESLLEKAVRLCGADRGLIYRQDGDLYHAGPAMAIRTNFSKKSRNQTPFIGIEAQRRGEPSWSVALYTSRTSSGTRNIAGATPLNGGL